MTTYVPGTPGPHESGHWPLDERAQTFIQDHAAAGRRAPGRHAPGSNVDQTVRVALRKATLKRVLEALTWVLEVVMRVVVIVTCVVVLYTIWRGYVALGALHDALAQMSAAWSTGR